MSFLKKCIEMREIQWIRWINDAALFYNGRRYNVEKHRNHKIPVLFVMLISIRAVVNSAKARKFKKHPTYLFSASGTHRYQAVSITAQAVRTYLLSPGQSTRKFHLLGRLRSY